MSKNTKEYQAVVRATAKLELAVKHNITRLCGELVSCGLITPDQKSRLRNPNHDVSERAADLVEIITNKVEQDPKNYDTFLTVLREDRTTYQVVLGILEQPFPDSTPQAHMTITEQYEFQQLWITSSATPPSCQCQMLSESHLSELLASLRIHATKWRDIGMHLGFIAGKLDNIQARPLLLQGAPESWLGAVLTDWLRRSSDDSRGGPTLDNLKLALSKSGLGSVSSRLTLSQ